MPARDVCERLMDMGVLAKDTHETTVRLAPALGISGRGSVLGDGPGPQALRERV